MILERPSGSLYYESHGHADGEIVVCLNGFASGISNWYPIARVLKRQFQVVLYDYVGTGESHSDPAYRFHLDEYCNDLKALLDRLGARFVHLVGYSMGGWVAQEFIRHHPQLVKSMVLVNTSSRIFKLQNWIISHFIEVLKLSDISTFSKLMFISYYSQEYFEKNQGHLDRIRYLADQYFRQHDRKNWVDMLHSCLMFDAEDALPALNQPILLVSGEHDYLCPSMTARRLHELIPGSQWLEFKDVGHAIPMERHRELGNAVDHFLATQASVHRCTK